MAKRQAPSLFRFFRYVRSFIIPFAAFAMLCFFLSIFLVLYQPVLGPNHIQRVGWQSWSLVTLINTTSPNGSVNGSGEVNSGPLPPGVPWWNVTASDPASDSASLPMDVWNPMLPHDTGLSEIAIEYCAVPPHMAIGTMCRPSTTKEEDGIKGNWVRVEGNLNAQTSIFFLHLWYRRTRRLDVPLITNITLLPADQSPSPESPHWHKVTRSLRDKVLRAPALHLWYYAERPRMVMSPTEIQDHLVTEIDILYGANVPWYGFQQLEPATTEEQEGRIEKVSLLYRKGVQRAPKAKPLHFSPTGHFKIMQIADLHFSVGRGQCRDTNLDPCSRSDNLTLSLVGKALDAEKPDLVVFTGDQLNGQKTSWDARSILAKFAKSVTDRGIPWAVVFGNHDDEDGGGRAEQVKMMQTLPYSLVERGPSDVHGVGNYVLKVRSADNSKAQLLTLYFLDSGAYAKGYFDWFGGHSSDYDYIRSSQTDWFLQESNSIPLLRRPYTPDHSDPSGEFDKRQAIGQTPSQHSRLAKPNAMMFFHIPLQEAYAKSDIDSATGKTLQQGLQLEGKGSSSKNEGFFEKGLLNALESDHSTGGSAREVKVVGNGHCHVTESCRRVKGVWFCFGGGGSYSGYSKVGFDRRFRIYDISDYGETIATYKRTEHDAIVDREVLAGQGAPSQYEGT